MRAQRVAQGAVAGLTGAVVLCLTACSGNGEPTTDSDARDSAEAITSAIATTAARVVQPPVPADPSGYTPEYVETTLRSLFQDFRAALVALRESGAVDETVSSRMAQVYHPSVLDQQIRNLEDYYPGGENVEENPGDAIIDVAGIHSATADCILAVTTFSIDALTTLDAPPSDNFFIGLARNPDDPAGDHPWLITVEYGTSDGEPLPDDVCG